ncbi:MAG: hypothetical protein ACTSQ7_00245 [Alphaproteobacteria bacterium]
MSLSKRVVETLIDLVEIKLSCVEVYDREDKREIAGLERCRQELQNMIGGSANGAGAVAGLAAEFKRPARATA